MMKHCICLGMLGLLLAAEPAVARDDRFAIPPAPSLLEARLVLNKDTYVLNAAQRGKAFRQQLENPPAPGQWQNVQPVPVQIMPVPAPPVQPAKPAAKDKKDAKQKQAKEANRQPQVQAQAFQIQIQGNQIQGNAPRIQVVPAQPVPPAKPAKDQPAAKEKKDPKEKPKEAKKRPPNIQAFQIQGQGQGIQIQAKVQIQGGIQIPGGQGMPAIRIMVNGAQALPPPPMVDMVLELHNVSGEEMTIDFGAADTRIDLILEGPGAVTTEATVAGNPRLSGRVKIAADGTYRIPIRSLQHGRQNKARSYWTEPGEYKLSASYTASLKSDSADAAKTITATAPPVKVKVVEPKGS